MTTLGDLFPSKYLRAADYPEPAVVTISTIAYEPIKNQETGKTEDKPVIYFAGVEKGMILNATNAKILASLYGDVIEDWYGKPVTLHSPDVEAFGKVAPALRFATRKPATAAAASGRPALVAAYKRLFSAAQANGIDTKDFEGAETLTDKELATVNTVLQAEINKVLAA